MKSKIVLAAVCAVVLVAAVATCDNTDKTAETLIETIKDAEVCELVPMSEEEARRGLEENDYAAALVIPEGFTEAIEENADAELILLVNPRRDVELQVLVNLVEGAAFAPAGGNFALHMADRFLDEVEFATEEDREEVRREIHDFISGEGGGLVGEEGLDWETIPKRSPR